MLRERIDLIETKEVKPCHMHSEPWDHASTAAGLLYSCTGTLLCTYP